MFPQHDMQENCRAKRSAAIKARKAMAPDDPEERSDISESESEDSSAEVQISTSHEESKENGEDKVKLALSCNRSCSTAM
jgi:hypothetical protein